MFGINVVFCMRAVLYSGKRSFKKLSVAAASVFHFCGVCCCNLFFCCFADAVQSRA